MSKAISPTGLTFESELLTYRVTGALVSFSPRTVRRLVAAGEFPAPIVVPGLRGKRFRRASVLGWLARLKEAQQ